MKALDLERLHATTAAVVGHALLVGVIPDADEPGVLLSVREVEQLRDFCDEWLRERGRA